MGERPRLFVELCCGSAAVTLRLLGGRYAVPPISYMGSKRGYAGAILAALGLRSGIGADRVLLCDGGPWAHVWGVLADPANCAEVARILRGWADEDPRALWERLREEHRGEWDGWGAERAAGWLVEGDWSTGNLPGGGGFNDNRTGSEGNRRPGDTNSIATRVESVAAWLQSATWAHRRGHPESGFNVGVAYRSEFRASNGDVGSRPPETVEHVAGRCDALPPAPLSVYAGPAEDLAPPDDCEGVYCYVDPPYQGTTGYAAKMPRETVLATARRWSDAGAVVCVSEAEPLPLDGWHHVEITGARVGQRRTFSRQQSEWLTMNREPVEVPAVQESLFPLPDPVVSTRS